MTDKETSLAFVERMESVEIPSHSVLISREDFLHLRQIAKTAALIEEHKINIHHIDRVGIPDWLAYTEAKNMVIERGSLFESVRALADKIKEQA